jgi:hypothetical protein
MGDSVTRICLPVVSLFLAGVVGSCATVDQFGYRASAGNLSVQDSVNKEVLLNIIRASQYRSFSWNPVNQATSNTTLGVTAGPSFTFGPVNAGGPSYSPTGSLTGNLMGGYTSSPLVTTSFQLGMITPISTKTLASLLTYYPREVIFYALVDSINIKLVGTNEHSRLVNDPAQDYLDINDPTSFDEQQCYNIARRTSPRASLFPGTQCSYSKFRALMQTLLEEGLFADLIEYPTTSAAQATNVAAQNSTSGASLLQTTTVAEGRFCLSDVLRPRRLSGIGNIPHCGDRAKPRNLGGSIVVTKTETQTADDRIVNTNTNSLKTGIVSTKNTLLPIGVGESPTASYQGLGEIQIDLVMRSPNGFFSYLGSWYNYRDQVAFDSYNAGYKSVPAKRIWAGGPYLAITSAPTMQCYASVEYNGQPYCVPLEATHTAMLMDLAVVLRNLNVQPTDLNVPATVRLAN